MATDPSTPPARAARWAGIPGEERVRERRALLLAMALDLFGTEGDAATSVRAVCRAAGLNQRYFYESFDDRDALLGALYDEQAEALGARLLPALEAAGLDPEARVRAGITTVLRFIDEDPRRARVLFSEGGTNPVLAERRRSAVTMLADLTAVEAHSIEGGQPGRLDHLVVAVMFGGAMNELALAWVAGRLGRSLDVVIDEAVARTMGLFGLPPAP